MPSPVNPTCTECRSCGETAPQDAHFCPHCEHILSLRHHGDYFAFLGLPHLLQIDAADLEHRFRDLSRRFHPDFFYNSAPGERLASLQRASYLNDAYRTLKNPVSRIEYLLSLEGFAPTRTPGAAAKVPAGLLEEVFALNEELDAIGAARAQGVDPAKLRARLQEARRPLEARRTVHERHLSEMAARWDALLAAGAPEGERRATLEALRERILERNYLNNLLASIEREQQLIG